MCCGHVNSPFPPSIPHLHLSPIPLHAAFPFFTSVRRAGCRGVVFVMLLFSVALTFALLTLVLLVAAAAVWIAVMVFWTTECTGSALYVKELKSKQFTVLQSVAFCLWNVV